MQTKKGFTLIELLVVIAIIAILAAILFPVFANARDKARQISDLSNIKQIALATIMYTNDYDDTYPIGETPTNGNSWWGGDKVNWILGIAPYSGSINVFFGPNDTAAGQAAVSNMGKNISYGVNALDGYDVTVGNTHRLGVFSASPQAWDTAAKDASAASVCKLAEITHPTQTILLADLQTTDTLKYEDWYNYGNPSGFAVPSLIGDSAASNAYGDSGPSGKFDDSEIYDSYAGGPSGTSAYQSWCTGNWYFGGAWMIPNPARKPSNAYPKGPSGVVSTPFSNGTQTNFAFADGHAKSMKPVATNPDGEIGNWYTGTGAALDPNNMWLVAR